MLLFIIPQTNFTVNSFQKTYTKLQHKGGVCCFMRRKSITSKMMKSFIAESLLFLLQQRPFEEITVGEIVQKAGVNRSTYYRHFERKEDIILYFLDCLSEDILEWDDEKSPEFKEHLINVYQHYYNHKERMMTIYKNGLSSLLLDVLKKNLSANETENENLDMQYDIAFHIGGTFNHFLLWLSRDMADTPEEMASHALAVLPENLIKHMWKATKRKVLLNNK